MKKYKIIELLILLTISICAGILLPNYFKYNPTITVPGLSELVIWTLAIFAVLTILFFGIKTKEKSAGIPDGYQKLYNEHNQIKKEGIFKNGGLVTGSKNIYTKEGSLSYTEIYTNGLVQPAIHEKK